jgi:putative phosphoribosyl transferase
MRKLDAMNEEEEFIKFYKFFVTAVIALLFSNREDAGKQLAAKLLPFAGADPLILAIPRGGVVVGSQVARALSVPLDIIIPRKIGAPFDPEVAIGAVTPDGAVLYEEEVLARWHLSLDQIQSLVDQAYHEMQRRMQVYRGQKPLPVVAGRVVILIDDGIATGFTVRAALRSIRRQHPHQLILAVPVIPQDTLEILSQEVDRLIYLTAPRNFMAVGQFYRDFAQTSDAEVIARLAET